jgi:hypothetical protein
VKLVFEEIRKLPDSEQVRERLRRILDRGWFPKGHRVFLRTLLERLSLFASGEIEEHEMFSGGWLMGQGADDGKEKGSKRDS